MGLTSSSTGFGANEKDIILNPENQGKLIALAGNPNVGKSSIFNALTGLKQHTGNWAGKTVANACGSFIYKGEKFTLADIPGTYSLYTCSKEEEAARNFICFSGCDAAIVVCDASCLERNLNLVFQIKEVVPKTIICINLIDEAEKKGIVVNSHLLEKLLNVPVVLTSAVKGIGLEELKERLLNEVYKTETAEQEIIYSQELADAIILTEEIIKPKINKNINLKWLSLKFIEGEKSMLNAISDFLGFDLSKDEELKLLVLQLRKDLTQSFNKASVSDITISQIIKKAEKTARLVVSYKKSDYNTKQYKIDKILTGKYTGIPIMLMLLAVIFWITIKGANYPSALLSNMFSALELKLWSFFEYINMPEFLTDFFILGIYKVVSWVIAVMLPPMAIFFPLFTLLEDLGYLPRIAFNLDKCFKCCSACGKQSLTMAMGFGCNAAGVVGCRIIDSPRERLIAIITNSMVPCNGRFPTLIAIITMFFVSVGAADSSFVSTVILTMVILFGILMTFFTSKLLSLTILKGVPSNFTLELPPYRKPQIAKLIVRSVLDRTLFVLARAVIAAVPAGAIIFLLANICYNDIALLYYVSNFLDPFAKLIGLDGVILMAFILGLPANEIVMPIILMAYLSEGGLRDYQSIEELKCILLNNGWTWLTAACTMIFSLMHWPCSTTLMTIKKETKSFKWTLISFLVPTVLGCIICFIITCASKIFQFVF